MAALDVITVGQIEQLGSAPDPSAFDASWQLGAQSWATTLPLGACDANACRSFSMSVTPSAVSIDANDSTSVHVSTTKLNDPNPISLRYDVPNGVVAGVSNPTRVVPGQGVDVGFAVPLGTPPGRKQPITIAGSNGIEKHAVNIRLTTTGCVPLTCSGVQCGSISDNCGDTLPCGSRAAGLVCGGGLCLAPHCARPRPCPRGSHWDAVECACVGD